MIPRPLVHALAAVLLLPTLSAQAQPIQWAQPARAAQPTQATQPTVPAGAAPAGYPSELPPAAQVRNAIDTAPEVRAAVALREAAFAERRQLIAGPQEWVGRAEYQRRRVTNVQNYREWELAMERQLRAPTKARIDSRLGDERAVEGELALADARHEASRRLLTLWYSWLRERAAGDALRSQAALVSREADAVARRQQLGDASRLERMQGQAAAAQASAAARAAEERATRAEIVILNRFPGIPFPRQASLPDPTLPGPELASLATTAITQNHGLLLAQANARRGSLESRRALAERRPDPTAGLRYRSELGGADRIVGVYVSIPFPGEARRAASDAALARADALNERAAATALQLNAEVRSLEQAVSSGELRWRAAEDAADLQAGVAERVAISRRLGETSFTEVLLARRQALETRLAATTARVDALENRARLLLDGHRLWDFDSDGEPEY